MELNNHGLPPSVFFQSLIDASKGFVLQIIIDEFNSVTVKRVNIIPKSNDNDNNF